MSFITRNSRYKEYGFVMYFEYREEARSVDSIPAQETVTCLLRPTTYFSALDLITHTVKQGETIHKIALYYFKDAKFWWFIADYNPLIDFNNLKEGDKILIPPNTEVNAY